MNRPMLYAVLAIQALFAAGLLYAGYASRECRKAGYLELTHRVTAGQATAGDFEKLAGFLPEQADKTTVRALFGLPVMRAAKIELKDTSALKGDFWIYYPMKQAPTSDSAITPVDAPDAEKFTGVVACFLVEFDARGRAAWRAENILHPIGAAAPAVPGK